MRRKRAFADLIVFMLVFVFVYTATDKLLHLERFRYSLATGPFTYSLSHFAWVLPAVELVTSLLLTFPVTRKAGFFMSAILFILFTGYVGRMLLAGAQLPCPCGGVFHSLNWNHHLLVDAFFATLSLLGWRWQSMLETAGKKNLLPPLFV